MRGAESEPSRPRHVYRTTLKKEFGLSDSWIARLGAPDKSVPNPHYRAGPPAQPYCLERVERFLDENSEEYARQLKRRARKSVAATDAVAKRREETLEWARSATIRLKHFPSDLRKTCQSRLHARVRFHDATDRDIVNMLRHEYTNYHDLLAALHGRIGALDGYLILKERVNAHIFERTGLSVREQDEAILPAPTELAFLETAQGGKDAYAAVSG